MVLTLDLITNSYLTLEATSLKLKDNLRLK
jgi:hypothetical protein